MVTKEQIKETLKKEKCILKYNIIKKDVTTFGSIN